MSSCFQENLVPKNSRGASSQRIWLTDSVGGGQEEALLPPPMEGSLPVPTHRYSGQGPRAKVWALPERPEPCNHTLLCPAALQQPVTHTVLIGFNVEVDLCDPVKGRTARTQSLSPASAPVGLGPQAVGGTLAISSGTVDLSPAKIIWSCF